MLDLETVFSRKICINQHKLNGGISIIDDINVWVNRFNNHLEEIGLSNNTIDAYKRLVKALVEYSNRYLIGYKGLSEFNDTTANDFLLWMENYNINRDFGSIKERIALLFDFLEFCNSSDDNDFINLREKYFKSRVTTESMEYALSEFEDYYLLNEIPLQKIDNNYIVNYINNIHKDSVSTMSRKKTVLIKFLKYIDDTLQSDSFDYTIKSLKVYKKAKGSIYKSKALSEASIKTLLKFIDDYTDNPKIFVKKMKKDAQHIAYRNTALILLMMGAGLRTTEALSLRYCDILDSNDSTYTIHIIGGKGNKNRTSYIKKDLFEKHFKYLNSYKKNDTDFISLSSAGNKLDRKNLYEFVKKIFIHLKIEEQGLHIFRHHFGATFAANNGNMKILQDLLGHSLITTTMTYSAVGEDAKKNAIAG